MDNNTAALLNPADCRSRGHTVPSPGRVHEKRPLEDPYLLTSNYLVEQATNEEIAELVRVLALHVAHRSTQYEDVSIEESL